MTEPADKPVTRPTLVTVAIELLLLAQVPASEGITFAVSPAQTSVDPPNTGFEGMLLITTSIEEGDIQLLALVTVKL